MNISLAEVTISLTVLVTALVATALGLLLIPLVLCITICCVWKKVNCTQPRAPDPNVTVAATDPSYEEIVTHSRNLQFEMNSNSAYSCNHVCM